MKRTMNGQCSRLETPELPAWFWTSRGIDMSPLTPSLSPSEGESRRAGIRAGEGTFPNSPYSHESGCLRRAGSGHLNGALGPARPAPGCVREFPDTRFPFFPTVPFGPAQFTVAAIYAGSAAPGVTESNRQM